METVRPNKTTIVTCLSKQGNRVKINLHNGYCFSFDTEEPERFVVGNKYEMKDAIEVIPGSPMFEQYEFNN